MNAPRRDPRRYYSRNGSTAQHAPRCAAASKPRAAQWLDWAACRRSRQNERAVTAVPDQGAPWATLEDLTATDGVIVGSPVRFGNMAAAMKHYLDQTSGLWLQGALVDKPAAVFTSSQTMHGGQESTLLSMMTPLLHHGMVLVGLPSRRRNRPPRSQRRHALWRLACHFSQQRRAVVGGRSTAGTRARGRVATVAQALKASRRALPG